MLGWAAVVVGLVDRLLVGKRWKVEVRFGRVWVRFDRSRRVWNCRSPLLWVGDGRLGMAGLVGFVGGLGEEYSLVGGSCWMSEWCLIGLMYGSR